MKARTVWRCTNCGEVNPDPKPTGFWQCYNSMWYHWCYGGRPGKWEVAVEVREVRDEQGQD